METYHKISTLFKRDQDGPRKGKIRLWDWTTPELQYLADKPWEFTEKVDGTNIRVGMWAGWEEPQFAGRTDRANIPTPLLEYLQKTFTRELFEDNDLNGLPIILFGEGYGGKIQSGGNYRPDQSFVLFDVKIGDWWLKREDVNDIANKLGVDSVPVVGYGTLYEAIELVTGRLVFRGEAELGPYKNESESPMLSIWGDFTAEGVVAVPTVPLFDRKGQRIITKVKVVDFK